jgi:ribosomal protein S18 acetylase RimI-like enzyme
VVAALQIRPGRLGEAGAIGVLTQRIYSAGGWTDKGYDGELLDAQARIEHGTLLVAEREGAVVGTVTIALPGTPFAEISRPDEAEIRMLAVAEDARGAGVASQLMDACEAYAREAGWPASFCRRNRACTLRTACTKAVAIRASPAGTGRCADSDSSSTVERCRACSSTCR